MYHLLAKHWKLILLWGLIGSALASTASLLLPIYYSAESQVLIISRDRSGVDPYIQAKSAERIGENLAQVMKTTDFMGKVMESTGKFNKDRWQKLNDRDRRVEWAKDVQPEVVYNTSLLKLTVYSTTKDDAAVFSDAVTQTLTTRGWEYVGSDIALKQVSSPLVSLWFARPNIIVNAVLGLIVGGLLAVWWLVTYRRHGLLGG